MTPEQAAKLRAQWIAEGKPVRQIVKRQPASAPGPVRLSDVPIAAAPPEQIAPPLDLDLSTEPATVVDSRLQRFPLSALDDEEAQQVTGVGRVRSIDDGRVLSK